MRFTLIKDLRQDTLMRPILSGLLLFTLFYLLSDVLVKHHSFGILTPDVFATLYGDEEQYIDAITTSSFLEFWHMEIFFSMMLLLTLCAVYARVVQNSRFDVFVLVLTFLSTLLTLIALALAFFFSDVFVSLYSYCFIAWHFLAFYMASISLWKLQRV